MSVGFTGPRFETTEGSGGVDGSGTANRLARWTDADSLGNGSITDTGSAATAQTLQVNGEFIANDAATFELGFSANGPGTINGPLAVDGATIRTVVGSPEGVVVGNVGDICLRTDGGATTTLYVKTSGVGNTGWTAK